MGNLLQTGSDWLSGGSFASDYPRLPEVIKAYMDAALGTGGGPIDVPGDGGRTVRQKWVETLRASRGTR